MVIKSLDEIRDGTILLGPYWPEKVQVKSWKKRGNRIELQVVGLASRKFYEPSILENELKEKVEIVSVEVERNFHGEPEDFRIALEAQRIRLAYEYDPHFAVSVSQVDTLPHQLIAVYHYLLKQPRIRFLLADDPGAGKTIMAGLLLKELKYRGLAKRILIIVPPNLISQWADEKEGELVKKFSEHFTIVNSSTMRATAGRNVWEEYDQCITSVDFAKQEAIRQSLEDVPWDLVIVDEAHKLAAYMTGKKTVKTNKTDRYLLGEIISKNSEHLVFLTATPHRGNPENFRLLLSLLDPDLYANEEILRQAIQKDENKIFLRRLKEDMIGWDGKRLFPPRHAHTMDYQLSQKELDLYNAVTSYIQTSFARLKPNQQGMMFGLMVLQRRLASSVRAIRKSLERKQERFEEYVRKGELPVEVSEIPELDDDDVEDENRLRVEEEAVEAFTGAKTIEELRFEVRELRGLVDLAKEVERSQTETKLEELRNVLENSSIFENEKEKLLIFTEHKDTLDYLVEKLRSWGLGVTQIHGMMNMDERVAAQRDFRDKLQVMVATEAAGEGINLQFCKIMINYDLPWNPNRLEQRMGRIHRYGQNFEVHIYNFVAVNTREGQVMRKVLEKLEIMRQHLGSDRVYDVVGEILQGVNLQQHIMDVLLERRTLDQVNQEITDTMSEEDMQKAKEASQEALCTRFIDLSRLKAESQYAKEQRLVPEYIERFFKVAFEKLGGKMRQIKPGLYRIDSIPYNVRFNKEAKKRFGDLKEAYPKISFLKQMKETEENVEVMSPGNPLFEAVVENILKQYGGLLLKGAVFEDSGGEEGVLYFYRGGVTDGRGTIIGERMFVVFQMLDGALEAKNPFILWDLKSAAKPRTVTRKLDEESGLDYAYETILEPYFAEMKGRREHENTIKRKYVQRSLDYLVIQKNKQIKKLTEKFDAGLAQPIEKQTLERFKREKEELIRKQENRLKELDQELNLSLKRPEIVATAYVLPMEIDEKESDFMHRDPEVEAAAMEAAMAYEIKQGRKPEDVSKENLGFDIRSTGDDLIRCIEVKGRAGVGPVSLTVNEWIKAVRFGDAYWLYIVTNAKTKPELHAIKNPAQNLKAIEEETVVRYIVAYQEWKKAENKV